MNMFMSGNSTLLISLFISFVLAGVVFYYCNSRIKNIEKTVVKQNHVLTEFIASFRGRLNGGTQHHQLQGQTQGQLQGEPTSSQIEYNMMSQEQSHNQEVHQDELRRIDVSDYEDDGNSSSEYETDSEYSSGDEEGENVEKVVTQVTNVEDNSSNLLSLKNVDDLDTLKQMMSLGTNTSLGDISLDDNDSSGNVHDVSCNINLDRELTEKEIKGMKKKPLKDYAVKIGIEEESIQKIKKQELIDLIFEKMSK